MCDCAVLLCVRTQQWSPTYDFCGSITPIILSGMLSVVVSCHKLEPAVLEGVSGSNVVLCRHHMTRDVPCMPHLLGSFNVPICCRLMKPSSQSWCYKPSIARCGRYGARFTIEAQRPNWRVVADCDNFFRYNVDKDYSLKVAQTCIDIYFFIVNIYMLKRKETLSI